MGNLHKHLKRIVPKHPLDYESLEGGKVNRNKLAELMGDDDYWPMDCSAGCKFYLLLRGKVGADWGVCVNPKSHRCGLLTFEHQGCVHFEGGDNGACDHDWEQIEKTGMIRCRECHIYDYEEYIDDLDWEAMREREDRRRKEAEEVISKVNLPTNKQKEIDELILNDKRIEAIRRIRDYASLELYEAKCLWERRRDELGDEADPDSP